MTEFAEGESLKIVPIFSGGGTRLTAHIGIIKALQELDLNFDHMVGISGGSIVSALYCCGRSLDDIMELALDTDFRQFRGYSVLRLLMDGGLSSGNKFEQWMDKQLNGITFKELPKNLNIVATDINGGGPVVFNKATAPDLKVSEAVRYSMSIPLLFSFKRYKHHLLVDGAILSEDALFQGWSGSNQTNVCFRLKSQQITTAHKRQSFFQLPEFIFMLIRTFMTSLSREYVHTERWHNTIVVNTGTISSVDFKMSQQAKHWLYRAGYESAKKFIPIILF
jgi:NTE family protein